MSFSKLLKAGATASLVLTCAGANAQSWISNSSYGLYVNPTKGTAGNVSMGFTPTSSFSDTRLTIKSESGKSGLKIINSEGSTKLWLNEKGGLSVGTSGSAPTNGLLVSGSTQLKGSLSAGATTLNSVNVTTGLAKFDGPVSMNGSMVASGTATFNNGMTVLGATQLAGSLSVTDAVSLSKTLNVTGKTTLYTLITSDKAIFKSSAQVRGTFDVSDYSTFDGGMRVKGGFSAALTDNNGYPGYISIGGTNKATIIAREFCGYQPACPKDLYFDAKDYIFLNGNVGIGVESPAAKLHVDGKILCSGEIEVADLNTNTINVNSLNAKDIQMDMHGAADYVFDENYNLKSLSEVESYVNEHKHLPGMPSAAEMDANGVSVSKMSNLLLEKVEELTLHMIQLEKENAALKAKVESLSK